MLAVSGASSIGHATLPVPVLHSPMIRIGFQYVHQLALNLFLRPKLESLHAFDNVLVQLVRSEGFSMNKVRIWWPIEASRHPWMVHNLIQSCPGRRIRD